MTGRNSKDKKHCKKWSTVRRHLILFAQKHIKIVQFRHKTPPCNGQVCILCCTSGPLARTAPPGGRRDRRPASPASTHSSHLRASPSSFPPLPPKSMLGGVAWAPGAMLPRPRPSFPTLISGGGGESKTGTRPKCSLCCTISQAAEFHLADTLHLRRKSAHFR